MPAMLDDPSSPPIYRTSGPLPADGPAIRSLPPSIQPRQVTLRDRTTIASLVPFSGPEEVPPRLMQFLCDLLNSEIENGDTYPMIDQLPLERFGPYWFANFAAVMVLGEVGSVEAVGKLESQGVDWKSVCLGSFYVKPNYPGRSSHVCNGGFLVSNASRNRGVGKLMGEGYLDWAPKLGYIYSVFNLVYETNHASIRIWDSLGFKRIGRVKGCGSLKSHPGAYVDAIIFGRDLGPESEDYVSEERFDKIRFYLKHQKYPVGADRAEKSRLRSAATHYHLVPGPPGEDEKLMLKDKEVVADTQKQYEIARQMHCQTHGGINKTTATIAEKYHWVRIKETVSLVIKNCPECKESSKVTNTYGAKTETGTNSSPSANTVNKIPALGGQTQSIAGREITPPQPMALPPMQKQAPVLPSPSQPQQQPQQQQQQQQQQQPPPPPSQQQQQQHPAQQQISLAQAPQPTLQSQSQPQVIQQTNQAQQPTPLLPSYEPSMHNVTSATPMSRTPSAARQSPNSRETSSSAPTTVSMAPPTMLHAQPPHTGPGSAISQAPPINDQMPQTLIPPHLNNISNQLGLTSANISPQNSTVHSPMPSGPASAPIGGMHNTFDMPLDPNLLVGIQNTTYSDLTGGGMDTAIQGMGNLDMDTNMHGMDDLNAMGLGDSAMHTLSDHGQVGPGSHQAGDVGLGQLGQSHDVNPGQILDHHGHQGQRDVKQELLGPDGMILDSEMGLGR